MIFDDATLVLVAEHVPSRRVVGIAGVFFEMGAYSDLVGGVRSSRRRSLARLCPADGFMCVEVHVGADGARMQRTLLEMGYPSIAHFPAMVLHQVERLDVLKMYRLFRALLELPFQSPEPRSRRRRPLPRWTREP
jgi:hypothetical protein